ncbi:MAG: type II secretion system protein GspL [Minisyncoccia bacterium]
MTRFIDRFFPLPHYLSFDSVGFDISDQSIRFVELSRNNTSIILKKFGEEKIPPGVVSAGKIVNKDQFCNVVTNLRKKYNFSTVRVSLPEEQVYLFALEIPKVASDSIRQTIELSLEEHIPITAADALFDYDLVTENSENYIVQVQAVPEPIVDAYLAPLAEAGLAVVSQELEAQAIARAIIAPDDNGTYMVLDFGSTRTGVSFISKGVVSFTTTFDIGGATQTEIIAKHFNITNEQAEALKRERGLLRSGDDKDLFAVLLNNLSILRDEINKHYIFWHTHPNEYGQSKPRVEKILLCGQSSNLAGFAEYLSASLKTQVVQTDAWVNIRTDNDYIPQIPKDQSLGYVTAIGLALSSFIKKQ